MTFKEYLKIILTLIPMFLLCIITNVAISLLSWGRILLPLVNVLILPFIIIKYVEWVIDKFD